MMTALCWNNDAMTGDRKAIRFLITLTLFCLLINTVVSADTTFLQEYDGYNALTLHNNESSFVDATGRHSITNSGTILNTTVKKLGAGSAQFDNNYLSSTDSADWYFSNKTLTIATWVMFDSLSTTSQTLVSQSADGNNEWLFRYDGSTNRLQFYQYISGYNINAICPFTPSTGEWYFVMYTNNGTTQHIYINGSDVALTVDVNSGSFTDLGAPLIIGNHPSYSDYQLVGKLDETIIMNGVAIANSSIYPGLNRWQVGISNTTKFVANVTTGMEPLSVQFNETSTTLGTSQIWYFTDVTGNNTEMEFSTAINTTKVFNHGNFSIKLNSIANGVSANSTQITFINVSQAPPVAVFTQNKTLGVLPLAVAFTDASVWNPNIWVWSINGIEIQNSTTIRDFTHTFGVVGIHRVNLTVWNTTLVTTPSMASQDIFVSSITYSDFTISNDHPFIFNETVSFTPIGPLVANRWLWNFGDGATFLDTNGTSVTHVYTTSASNTTLSASLTAYVIENTSITNTTSHAIYPILFPSFVEASFSGSPTTGSVGVNVMFTDTSKFGTSNADSGRTYNWSFGDNGYSSNPYSNVVGDVSHVYTNLGTYTVTLTVNNTLNSSSYSIVNFITVSNQQNYAVTYPPKDVRFHIQTLYGQAIPNTLVQANPRQTSTGSYSYTASLFGYQLGVVPLNNLTLSGYTDSKGDITMAMMADVQYEMGFSAAGYTFDNQTITPHDDNYIIMPRGTGGSPFVTNGSSPQTNVLFTAKYTRYNETAALLYINYTDYSLLTTGGDITLYRPNTSLGYTYNNVSEQENFVSVHFTGPNTTQGYILIDGATPACPSSSSAIFTDTYTLVACTNQTLVNDKSYFAAATGMTPGGNVSVQAPVWFKNIHTPIAGLSAEFALFAALGIMMFTAMMATPTTAPAISIAFAFEGWIFYGMNMLQLIDSPTQSGASVVVEVLIVITGIAIVYNFVDFRRKGK